MSVAMTRPSSKTSRLSHIAGITAVLLTLTLAFCAVHCAHSAGHDHELGVMVCGGTPASLLILMLLVGPLAAGYLLLDPFRSAYGVSLVLLDPPPKALALS